MKLKKFLKLIRPGTKFKVFVVGSYAGFECKPSKFQEKGDFIVTGIKQSDGYIEVLIEHGDLSYNTELKKWVKHKPY